MKTISVFLFLGILLSFRSQTVSTATPQKVQGIDVYVMSEPVRAYEVIKTGSQDIVLTCKGSINAPIGVAAKTEGAEGVIIHFPQSSKYSVIKYTE